jgi:hypothetical protein
MVEHTPTMGRDDLERVRAWANAKLATGEEPPWAWYQYMKLCETLDAILAGMTATQPTGDSQEPAPLGDNGITCSD